MGGLWSGWSNGRLFSLGRLGRLLGGWLRRLLFGKQLRWRLPLGRWWLRLTRTQKRREKDGERTKK